MAITARHYLSIGMGMWIKRGRCQGFVASDESGQYDVDVLTLISPEMRLGPRLGSRLVYSRSPPKYVATICGGDCEERRRPIGIRKMLCQCLVRLPR